jgi:hypothetical protein
MHRQKCEEVEASDYSGFRFFCALGEREAAPPEARPRAPGALGGGDRLQLRGACSLRYPVRRVGQQAHHRLQSDRDPSGASHYGSSGGVRVGAVAPNSETVAVGRGVGSVVGLGIGVGAAVGVSVGRRSGGP